MIGHDQVSTVTNKKATRIDTMIAQVVYFSKKHCWVNSYAIANNASYLWVKNARRDKMQPELAIGVDHSVASIISPGETSYYLRFLS
jgi:hypothetical protein